MKLNVLERITALGLVPEKGNNATHVIINDLKLALGLNEADFKEFGIKQIGGQMTWNSKGLEEREIKIGEKATDILVEALEQLNKAEDLDTIQNVLFEKFVKKAL